MKILENCEYCRIEMNVSVNKMKCQTECDTRRHTLSVHFKIHNGGRFTRVIIYIFIVSIARRVCVISV